MAMTPVRVYGYEMLLLISLNHIVTEELNYKSLPAHTQDKVLNFFTSYATADMYGDCLLGEGNFGPLVAEFKNSDAAYILALDTRMSNEARKGATAEDLAEMLGCQELTNHEFKMQFCKSLFDAFCESQDELCKLAHQTVVNYMTRQIINQIEEALPAFLEERREAARNLMEYAA